MSTSARMRRRPSIRCEIGSCAITITAVLTAKMSPIWRSVTPLWSRANWGRRVMSE